MTAAALVVGAIVAHAVDGAAEARRRWGETRAVLVATSDIAAGEPLAGKVRVARWPAALVPRDRLARTPDDARARAPIAAGTPVVGAAVLRADDADLRRRRLVGIALGDASVAPVIGTQVDLWATVDPSLVAEGELSTHRVAAAALVVEVDDGRATVAVEPGEVAAVAEATAVATVTVVQRP